MHPEVVDVLSSVVEKVRGDIRTHGEYRLGSSYLLVGKPDEALVVLRRAAEDGTGIYRFPSQILRAAANYQAGVDADENLRMLSRATILAVTAEESVGGELGDATVVPSLLYSVGYSALGAGYNDDAVEYLNSALALAPPGLLPAIYITKSAIETNVDSQRELALLACDAIIKHQLHPVAGEAGAAAYTERGLITVLLALSEIGLPEDVRRLVSFVIANDKIQRSAAGYISHLLTNLPDQARLQQEWVLRLLDSLEDEAVPNYERLDVEHAYCMFAREGDKLGHVKKLVSVLEVLGEPIEEKYLSLIVLALSEPVSSNDFGSILNVTMSLEKLRGSRASLWDCLAAFYKMIAERGLGRMDYAKQSALILIDMASELHSSSPNEIMQIADNLISQARNLITETDKKSSSIIKRIGPNSKVKVLDKRDGKVFTVKYKLIAARLKNGNYSIIP